MPVIGITPQCFLDLQGEAVHAAAHIGVAGGQPHPHPARQRDHRRTSTCKAAVTMAGSTTPAIRTRSPCGSSISITPRVAPALGPVTVLFTGSEGLDGAIVTA